MSLSLVDFTLVRDTTSDDTGGGQVRVQSTVASLQGRLNYVNRSRMTRLDRSPGPGVTTAKQGVISIAPPPTVTILDSDRAIVGTDHWLVWGVRSYERTMQLDVELLTSS